MENLNLDLSTLGAIDFHCPTVPHVVACVSLPNIPPFQSLNHYFTTSFSFLELYSTLFLETQ